MTTVSSGEPAAITGSTGARSCPIRSGGSGGTTARRRRPMSDPGGTMELTFDERRVAGVLIEKGYTTPEQYPLTMNALVVGSNQKSCRHPVMQIDEERVFLAIDGLRKKRL